jgi:hypothetical protein
MSGWLAAHPTVCGQPMPPSHQHPATKVPTPLGPLGPEIPTTVAPLEAVIGQSLAEGGYLNTATLGCHCRQRTGLLLEPCSNSQATMGGRDRLGGPVVLPSACPSQHHRRHRQPTMALGRSALTGRLSGTRNRDGPVPENAVQARDKRATLGPHPGHSRPDCNGQQRSASGRRLPSSSPRCGPASQVASAARAPSHGGIQLKAGPGRVAACGGRPRPARITRRESCRVSSKEGYRASW